MRRIQIFTKDHLLQMWTTTSNSICKGRFATFLVFILFGLIVSAFLFLTVHTIKPIPKIFCHRLFMDQKPITVWIEHGYFKHGGLLFETPLDKNPTQTVWSSGSTGFLQGAHIIQRIYYWFTGQSFNRILMKLHNQGVILISSALLGFLAFLICSRLKLCSLHGFLLGISAQVIYQTFPYNLFSYWRFYPAHAVCFLEVLFLILLERIMREGPLPRWIHWACAFTVFAMFRAEHIGSFFLIAGFYFITVIIKPKLLSKQKHLLTILLPACLAVGLFVGQKAMIGQYTEVKFHGSTFMFRTGLDGSLEYFNTHKAIITTTQRQMQWKYFFIGGVLSTLVLIAFSIKDRNLRPDVIIVATALLHYVFFAFLFVQATVIHTHCYDVYLALPMTLALFVYLPVILERVMKYPGVFIAIFVVLAFCYSMVQLRTYAMTMNFPPDPILPPY